MQWRGPCEDNSHKHTQCLFVLIKTVEISIVCDGRVNRLIPTGKAEATTMGVSLTKTVVSLTIRSSVSFYSTESQSLSDLTHYSQIPDLTC